MFVLASEPGCVSEPEEDHLLRLPRGLLACFAVRIMLVSAAPLLVPSSLMPRERCGFESRHEARSSKTARGGLVQAQALVSSSPFLELEAFNKDPTGSISLGVCLCVGPVS